MNRFRIEKIKIIKFHRIKSNKNMVYLIQNTEKLIYKKNIKTKMAKFECK